MLGGASAHYLAAVGQFILVAGISFGLLCFLTSFFRFQALAEKVVAGGPGRAAPPANALEIEVARRIGLAGPSVAGPAVLLVKASSVEAGEQAGVFPALRSLVRRDDLLVELDEGEMGLVLDTERDQVVRVADRLRDALNRGVRTVENGLVKAVLHMGAATYPENGVRAGNLVAAARVVLEQAQASGEGFLLAEGAATPSAERAEGRGPAKGNLLRGSEDRTQNRESLQAALERIRQAASRDKTLRLTTLWHHVYDVARLRESFYALKRNAAPGVDGQTWDARERDLEFYLQEQAPLQ